MCGGGGGGVRGMHPPADTTRYGDTVNEWAVHILLECILVSFCRKPSRENKGKLPKIIENLKF